MGIWILLNLIFRSLWAKKFGYLACTKEKLEHLICVTLASGLGTIGFNLSGPNYVVLKLWMVRSRANLNCYFGVYKLQKLYHYCILDDLVYDLISKYMSLEQISFVTHFLNFDMYYLGWIIVDWFRYKLSFGALTSTFWCVCVCIF